MGSREYLVGGVELDLSLLEEFGPVEAPIELAKDLVAPSVVGDDKEQLSQILDLARQVEEIQKFGGYTKWFVPGTQYGIDKLHKHREFFWAGSKYHERYFSAANQVGKSTALAFETTLHATGLYPDWWKGKRFTKPISAIVAGSTNETTRNIIQKELCGDIGSLGTGMIPKDCIVKTTSKSGVSNAFDVMMVKHKSGGLSTIYFKSYDQDRRAFEGVKTDWVWLDEMPPPDIYSECYTRTITRNGLIAVSATPLDGLTPVVLNFYSTADFLPPDTPLPNIIRMVKEEHEQANEELIRKGETPIKQSNSKAVIVAGWVDAPWLTEEAKIRVLAATPAHLRQARSTGVPGDTGGAVFPIAMSDLLVDDFPIPAHYKLINGLDPGWHNTGAAFGALDPDTDTLYIYADYKRGQAETLVHAEALKSKSKWADAPVIFDYAGMGGRSEEESTRTLYRKYGLKLINADKAVMAGISAVWERMSTGKLKIFKSCRGLQQELATYRMDETGKIIKENDHCLHPDTLVHTDTGLIPIKDMVGTEGMVLTVGGVYVPYCNVRMTAKNQEMVKVTLEDGSSILCTPDHKLLTSEGWIEAIDSLGYLLYNADSAANMENARWSKSKSSQAPNKSSLGKRIGCAVTTFNDTVSAFTAQFMSITTGLSQKVTTFTTKTTTRLTTPQTTLNWYMDLSTCPTIPKDMGDLLPSNAERPLQSGTGLRTEKTGIANITNSTKKNFMSVLKSLVRIVEKYTKRLSGAPTLSAQTIAKRHFAASQELMTVRETVQYAVQSLSSICTPRSRLVQKNALNTHFEKVVKIEPIEKSDVYCMEVPDVHCFAVGNGVVVHNCIDPVRYICMGIKHARTPNQSSISSFGTLKGQVGGKKYFS